MMEMLISSSLMTERTERRLEVADTLMVGASGHMGTCHCGLGTSAGVTAEC